MEDQAIPDVRPGQRWRLTNGDEVTVDGVDERGQVSGASNQAALGPMGAKGLSGAMAGYVGHMNDFIGAQLLRPRWRANFLAKVRGEGLADDVLQRLQRISTVEARGTPRIDTGTNVLHEDHAEYVVELPAVDEGAARSRLKAQLGDDLVGDVEDIRLTQI